MWGYQRCIWIVNGKDSCRKETRFERIPRSGRVKCGWFRRHEVLLYQSQTCLRNLHCTGLYIGRFPRCRIMLSDWDRIQAISAKDSTKTDLYFFNSNFCVFFLIFTLEQFAASGGTRVVVFPQKRHMSTETLLSSRVTWIWYWHTSCTEISPSIEFTNVGPGRFCFRYRRVVSPKADFCTSYYRKWVGSVMFSVTAA